MRRNLQNKKEKRQQEKNGRPDLHIVMLLTNVADKKYVKTEKI